MDRHKFNRNRVARRLARVIKKQMQDLIGTRQAWDEWRMIEQMQANFFKQERG